MVQVPRRELGDRLPHERPGTTDVAGKTGTSQDYRDAWFIGYSSELIAGVWVGNDDNSPTRRVTGGTLPAEIWKDVMEPAHAGRVAPPLPGGDERVADMPGTIAQVDIDDAEIDSMANDGFFERLFGRSALGEDGEPRRKNRMSFEERAKRAREER